MRTFVVVSETARTDLFIRDLKAAGRWDVLLHSIVSSLFASNKFRDDVELHLLLLGPPNSPRHIIIKYDEENSVSKKDLKKLIEMCLRKCKTGERRKVHPGVFVDDMGVEEVVLELSQRGEVFVLDANGEHIKDIGKNLETGVFVLGDHDGFDKKSRKFLKKNCKRMSLGSQIYFTSQAITIINYEVDNLNL